MGRTHYNTLAAHYIRLAALFPDFPEGEPDTKRELWQIATTVIEELSFGERYRIKTIIAERYENGHDNYRAGDYRRLDKVYKMFAQRAGLI